MRWGVKHHSYAFHGKIARYSLRIISTSRYIHNIISIHIWWTIPCSTLLCKSSTTTNQIFYARNSINIQECQLVIIEIRFLLYYHRRISNVFRIWKCSRRLKLLNQKVRHLIDCINIVSTCIKVSWGRRVRQRCHCSLKINHTLWPLNLQSSI